MTTLINLLMVLVAAALIGYPFILKDRRRSIAGVGNEAAVDNRELLFSALGEIEFDYQMKKLSDEDYRQLKAGYQEQALAVLEKEDEMLEKELDRELSKRKKVEGRGMVSEEDYE